MEHIRNDKTPKKAWDTLTVCFFYLKKAIQNCNFWRTRTSCYRLCNVTSRLLEHFHKIKSICCKISELDPSITPRKARIKGIIVHDFISQYRSFVAAAQGWQTQPSLIEFENLLANQVAMAKLEGEVLLKCEEKALYTNKSKGNPSSTTKTSLKRMMTRQKVIEEREVLIQGELRRIVVVIKSLMANVSTMGRGPHGQRLLI